MGPETPSTDRGGRDGEEGEQNEIQGAVCEGGRNGGRTGESSTMVEESVRVASNSNRTAENVEGGSGAAPVRTAREQCMVRRPDETMLRYMMHYLDLVHCDYIFMALCMLFDERLESKFHIIVGAFREKYDNKGVRAPYLVRPIMAYAHEKVFAANSGSEQRQREASLRSARDNFVVVRSLYGLKAYEEMRWVEPDEN